ncbi:hypothetical protein, partial [Labrenzia sp. 5N]|uniref:hypothetical protein n=1 Tax=Labrenzia sp. 5N TaxID=2723402 RepID=UPI001A916898
TLAMDIQQRAAQHGHRRYNACNETENSSLKSSFKTHQKWDDYQGRAPNRQKLGSQVTIFS